MSHAKITVLITEADGTQTEHELPSKFEVCHRCAGCGTHTNPNIDGNGITASEMEELGEDFRTDYLAGVYDVQCEACHGQRVVAVVDEDRCPPALLEQYRADARELAELEAEEYMERRAELWAAGEWS